jgi:trans-aconitate methyltransferase
MTQQAAWNANLYDDKHSFVWKMAAGVLELLAPKPNEKILDVGCGTGHLTTQIAEAGADVLGIDRSTDMIRQAKEKYPSLRFEVMDATQINVPETYDAVFSNATLHWIKEPERVITGIAKALRPGGRFVAEFGGKGNTAGFLDAVQKSWAKLQLASAAPQPWYYPSIAEYSALLEKHGFEVTYAILFDRPTPLEDGGCGLRNWFDMFGASFLQNLSKAQKSALRDEIEDQARPKLFHSDKWVMDYRRLRVVAHKSPTAPDISR